MNLTFEIPIEINAKASSTWNLKHVEDRLIHLKTLPQSPETQREIRFLQKLKFKR